MSESFIKIDGQGKARISGEMTFTSTPGLYRELEILTRGNGEIDTLDLDDVGRADSSGLALLLEWQAVAARKKRKLQIRNAPDDLLRLAKLCEADTLLDISGRAINASS